MSDGVPSGMTNTVSKKAGEQAMPSPAAHDPTANPKTAQADAPSNAQKDPDDWTTGGETMTGAQASYLKTLCEEAGEAFDPSLTKAAASKQIDALQSSTGRGKTH